MALLAQSSSPGGATLMALPKALTAHYFLSFGVNVQVLGDSKNVKVEPRVLHLDIAATALQLVYKGSVRVFLRFDALNQIVYDEAEPAAVLLSCRDGRKYFVAFQSAEDCLVFRTACTDLVSGTLDMNRFQRTVLRKGALYKQGVAGTLFGEKYAILTPRKLYLLASRVAVFPSAAISLVDVAPRYDDAKGAIYLEVGGKEVILKGSDKEESQEWFVAIASAATTRVPILTYSDAEAAEALALQDPLAAHQQQQGDPLGGGGGVAGLPFVVPGSFQGQQRQDATAGFFLMADDDEDSLVDHHIEAPMMGQEQMAGVGGYPAGGLPMFSMAGGGLVGQLQRQASNAGSQRLFDRPASLAGLRYSSGGGGRQYSSGGAMQPGGSSLAGGGGSPAAARWEGGGSRSVAGGVMPSHSEGSSSGGVDRSGILPRSGSPTSSVGFITMPSRLGEPRVPSVTGAGGGTSVRSPSWAGDARQRSQGGATSAAGDPNSSSGVTTRLLQSSSLGNLQTILEAEESGVTQGDSVSRGTSPEVPPPHQVGSSRQASAAGGGGFRGAPPPPPPPPPPAAGSLAAAAAAAARRRSSARLAASGAGNFPNTNPNVRRSSPGGMIRSSSGAAGAASRAAVSAAGAGGRGVTQGGSPGGGKGTKLPAWALVGGIQGLGATDNWEQYSGSARAASQRLQSRSATPSPELGTEWDQREQEVGQYSRGDSPVTYQEDQGVGDGWDQGQGSSVIDQQAHYQSTRQYKRQQRKQYMHPAQQQQQYEEEVAEEDEEQQGWDEEEEEGAAEAWSNQLQQIESVVNHLVDQRLQEERARAKPPTGGGRAASGSGQAGRRSPRPLQQQQQRGQQQWEAAVDRKYRQIPRQLQSKQQGWQQRQQQQEEEEGEEEGYYEEGQEQDLPSDEEGDVPEEWEEQEGGCYANQPCYQHHHPSTRRSPVAARSATPPAAAVRSSGSTGQTPVQYRRVNRGPLQRPATAPGGATRSRSPSPCCGKPGASLPRGKAGSHGAATTHNNNSSSSTTCCKGCAHCRPNAVPATYSQPSAMAQGGRQAASTCSCGCPCCQAGVAASCSTPEMASRGQTLRFDQAGGWEGLAVDPASLARLAAMAAAAAASGGMLGTAGSLKAAPAPATGGTSASPAASGRFDQSNQAAGATWARASMANLYRSVPDATGSTTGPRGGQPGGTTAGQPSLAALQQSVLESNTAYLIPSVVKAIVNSPEGRALGTTLLAQGGITGHQKTLALLLWVLEVYRQLPPDVLQAPQPPPSPNANTAEAAVRLTDQLQRQQLHQLQTLAAQQQAQLEQLLKEQQQRQKMQLAAGQTLTGQPWGQPMQQQAAAGPMGWQVQAAGVQQQPLQWWQQGVGPAEGSPTGGLGYVVKPSSIPPTPYSTHQQVPFAPPAAAAGGAGANRGVMGGEYGSSFSPGTPAGGLQQQQYMSAAASPPGVGRYGVQQPGSPTLQQQQQQQAFPQQQACQQQQQPVQYGFVGPQQYHSSSPAAAAAGQWVDYRSTLSPQPMGMPPPVQQYGPGLVNSSGVQYSMPLMQAAAAGAAPGQPVAVQQPGNVLAEYQADLSHLMPGVGLTVRVRQPAAAAAITAQQVPSPRNYTPGTPGDASAPLAAAYQHLHENPLFGEEPAGGLGGGQYTPTGGDSYGQYAELQYRPTRRLSTPYLSAEVADAICQAAAKAAQAAVVAVSQAVTSLNTPRTK